MKILQEYTFRSEIFKEIKVFFQKISQDIEQDS